MLGPFQTRSLYNIWNDMEWNTNNRKFVLNCFFKFIETSSFCKSKRSTMH